MLLVIAVGRLLREGRQLHAVRPAGASRARPRSGLGRAAGPELFGFAPSDVRLGGILAGAAIVFFAFIGFDIVATAAEETSDPARDMPRGILGSLAICTVLYVAVSLVVVGMQHYTELNADGAAGRRLLRSVGLPFFAGDHLARRARRPDLGGHDPAARPVAGAVRDEPRPPAAAAALARCTRATARRTGSPSSPASSSRCWPASSRSSKLAELVNIGTLFAFVLVSIGVIDPAPHPAGPAARRSGCR